jgi:diguanylate cyclase (GGDEF)-like protein/PAS domain S-box-containing protein
MTWLPTPFSWLLLASALVSIILGVHAYQRRNLPAASPFAVLMGIQALWAILYVGELSSASLESKLIYAQLQYLCYVSLPLVLWSVALKYTSPTAQVSARQVLLLALIPLLTLLLMATNSTHGLVWQEIHLVKGPGFSYIAKLYGPWFWIHTTYSYLLIGLALARFLESFFSSPPQYRGQSLTLLLGLAMPFSGNVAFLFGLIPARSIDPTPLLFTLSGLVMLLGLFRYRLFETNPIPQEDVIKSMSEGLLVMDRQNRLVDVNPAARKILDLADNSLLNHPVEQILRPWPDLTQLTQLETMERIEFVRQSGKEKQVYDVRKTPLRGWRGARVGNLLIFHNITELKRVQAELLQLSLTDPLTGLANRRKLLEIMQAEITQAARYKLPLSLIMLDLDNLKGINDTFGHAAGDEALRIVAQVLKLTSRQADLPARLGGDEFVLLLPHTPLAGAKQHSLTLKEAISSLKISQGMSIGISLGAACYDAERDHQGEDLIARADQALYQAKSTGGPRRHGSPTQPIL